jgi:hypothetical protein
MQQSLITEIEGFLADAGMSPFRFGLLAVRNGRLVERLRCGRRVWPETESKVRGFIAEHRKRASASAEQDQGAA